MTKPAARASYGMALALLCAVPSAFPADMQLQNSFPNGALADVYIGPYTALIDGVSTLVICDDYSTETYVGPHWTAKVSTFPTLANTKFGVANETTYKEVAWLSLQLLNPSITCPISSNNCAGDIQFAIWQAFDNPNPFNRLSAYSLTNDLSNANYWLTEAAKASNYDSVDLTGFAIYTADPLGAAQEFIVKTPESSALALLGIDLSAVGGLFLLFRRRSLNHHST